MGRETQLPKKDGANQPDNLPLYLFRNGTNRRAYEYLGLHKTTHLGRECMVARCGPPMPGRSPWWAISAIGIRPSIP